MDTKAAKSTGGKLTGLTALIILISLLAIALYKETAGDFSNGFIFFLEEFTNRYVGGLIILYLVMAWFFGRNAGKEIISEKKKHVTVGIKYALLESVILLAYLLIVYAANGVLAQATQNIGYLILALLLLTTLVWLWSATLIKRKAIK